MKLKTNIHLLPFLSKELYYELKGKNNNSFVPSRNCMLDEDEYVTTYKKFNFSYINSLREFSEETLLKLAGKIPNEVLLSNRSIIRQKCSFDFFKNLKEKKVITDNGLINYTLLYSKNYNTEIFEKLLAINNGNRIAYLTRQSVPYLTDLDSFIDKYNDKFTSLEWKLIAETCHVSEYILKKYIDKFSIDDIIQQKNLSSSFLKEYVLNKHINKQKYHFLITQKNLDKDIIIDLIKNTQYNLQYVLRNVNLTDEIFNCLIDKIINTNNYDAYSIYEILNNKTIPNITNEAKDKLFILATRVYYYYYSYLYSFDLLFNVLNDEKQISFLCKMRNFNSTALCNQNSFINKHFNLINQIQPINFDYITTIKNIPQEFIKLKIKNIRWNNLRYSKDLNNDFIYKFYNFINWDVFFTQRPLSISNNLNIVI